MDEQMFREEDLDTKPHVHLEMIRIPHGLVEIGAHRGSYAGILVK